MNIVVSTALVLALSMTLVSASDESTVSKTSEKILAEIMRILKNNGILEAEAVEEPVEAVQDVTNLDLEAELMEQPSSVKSAAEENEAEEASEDESSQEASTTQEVSTSRDAVIAEIIRIIGEEAKAKAMKASARPEEPLEAASLNAKSSESLTSSQEELQQASASNEKVSTARNENLAAIMEIFKEEELVLAKQMEYLNALLSASVRVLRRPPPPGRR